MLSAGAYPSPDASPTHTSEPELTPEAQRKRMKAREYVRKTYEKKKTTLRSLREQLDGLELQYKALLESSKLSSASIVSDELNRSRDSRLQTRYDEITLLKQRLYAENQALYRMNTDNMILGGRLQQVIDMEAQPSLAELPFDFVPRPADHYTPAITLCRDRALQFVQRTDRITSGLDVFGWRDYRRVVGTELIFTFEKQFDGISAEDLLERTWALLSNPNTFSSIYSASLNSSMHVLQHIDRDTILCYWTMRPHAMPITTKLLFVLARRPVSKGFIISFTTVDKEVLQFEEHGINELLERAKEQRQADPNETQRSVHWAFMGNWAFFERIGPKSCRYRFGGESQARIWMVETLLIVMRWENQVAGLRLLRAD